MNDGEMVSKEYALIQFFVVVAPNWEWARYTQNITKHTLAYSLDGRHKNNIRRKISIGM